MSRASTIAVATECSLPAVSVLRSGQRDDPRVVSVGPRSRRRQTRQCRPARIRQLRQRAASRGLDPNKWFNNVEVLAAESIGRETVQYVANIYKYYLAYQMLTEEDAQRQKARGDAGSRRH